VDPSFSGYGIHSQKPWNPGTVERPPSNESNAAFQPPPLPLVNQTKLTEDSWDWNVDNGNNGNDSWNWSIEQSSSSSSSSSSNYNSSSNNQFKINLFLLMPTKSNPFYPPLKKPITKI
jgi:hypothetical protein